MASPEPFRDDDPTPRGFPRLMGDRMGRLAHYRATAEMRSSASPGLDAGHLFHRDLMIALAIKLGMTHEVVAGVMGLSRSRITHICSRMEALVSRDDAAD